MGSLSVVTVGDPNAVLAMLMEIGDDIVEDGTSIENYWPDVDRERWLLVCDDEPLGYAHLKPRNSAMLELHLSVFKKHRAAKRVGVTKAIWRWVCENTNYEKLVAEIPAIHRHVVAHAVHCGMKREGLLKESYRKNGRLVDLVVLGIDRKTMEMMA